MSGFNRIECMKLFKETCDMRKLYLDAKLKGVNDLKDRNSIKSEARNLSLEDLILINKTLNFT